MYASNKAALHSLHADETHATVFPIAYKTEASKKLRTNRFVIEVTYYLEV